MREIELFVIGAEIGEEVETFVQRPVGLGFGLVDLVQHDDRAQAQGQRLGGYELRLRHRAFGGIDQQHHTVDHGQDPLHLAAEIGVAGGVHDVDADAFPFDRSGLGEDRDAALALEIVAVHGAFGRRLVFAVSAGLLEKLVHQRGLAVVDVSDDCDIAQVHEKQPSIGEVARLRRIVWGRIPRGHAES